MSLILDALNRADQERKNQDRAPDIHTVHPAPAALAKPGLRAAKPLLLGVLAVLLLLVAVLVWWMLTANNAQSSNTSQVTPTSSSTAEPAPTLPSTPASTPGPTPATTSTTAPPKKLSNPGDGANKAAVNALPATADNPAVADLYQVQSSSVANKSPVDQLYQQERAAPMAEAVQIPESTPVATSQSLTANLSAPQRITGPAQDFSPRRLSSIRGIPYFNDLPWSQKQGIPTISYARHDYLPSGISTVVINGETRGIGNQVAHGQFVIEDICEDGVVLRYGELRFKLPALSGWVNM